MDQAVKDDRRRELPAPLRARYRHARLDDLLATADLQPGERGLDVACGTGVIARFLPSA